MQHQLTDVVCADGTAGITFAQFIGCALNGTDTVHKRGPFSRFTDAKAVSEVLAYWIIKTLCKCTFKLHMLHLNYIVLLSYCQSFLQKYFKENTRKFSLLYR